MNRTKIEWTEYTWNPITGCSSNCGYCYARRMAYRLRGRCGYPQDEPFRPTFHPDRILEPTLLKKPSKIFTCSMGEFFDREVPALWRELVLCVMHHTPHTYQILTKKPLSIPVYEEPDLDWPSNLWLGVSVDGVTTTADLINRLDAKEFPFTTFVSFEPLLGRIDFSEVYGIPQWVIIGAQTGPNAKPPRKEWIGDILLWATEYDIPVFLKDNLQLAMRCQEWPKASGLVNQEVRVGK